MSNAGYRRRYKQSESEMGRHWTNSVVAGKASTLAVPHPMRPHHVDKLKLVVNRRTRTGQLRGYDGPCKADGHLIQRTYIEVERTVKGADGIERQLTALDILPTGYRDMEVTP